MRRIGRIRNELRPDRQTRTHPWGTGAGIAAAIVFFALYVLVLGRGAAWLDGNTLRGLTASQRASEIDTMRGYLIQAGAGLFALGALVYTARNFRLAREGHVTDRYTKAIEQLGSEHLDVRLGAIYALERIMIDSARDHPTIVEVLAAFVREHAPAGPPGPDPDDGCRHPEQPQPPATDVQAAVTVLGRRPAGRTERGPVNLTRTRLTAAVLTRADLTGADLREANLFGAELSRARLTDARLSNAMLATAHLFYADLVGARLDFADLARTDLTGAHLDRAEVTGANLTGAHLDDAHLTGAQLWGANLTSATLTGANLTGANLTGARLTGVNLAGVMLTDEQRRAMQAPPGGGSLAVPARNHNNQAPNSRPRHGSSRPKRIVM